MTARSRDRIALLGVGALALTAAYRGQVALGVLAATALIALLVARYWGYHSLDQVAYERTLGDQRAFAGDTVDITLRLTNGKLLPLPVIEVRDPLPAALALVDGAVADRGVRLSHAVSLSWHERVTWRHQLLCQRRGVFTLGPAAVTSGDPFGLFTSEQQLGGSTSLVVYPRLVPVDMLRLPPAYPQGDRRAERWIFEDASRTIGAREYRRGDTLRRIHWKATARRQGLQTRVYEPTTDVEIALFLAIGTFRPARSRGTDESFERAVSVAASLSHLLVDRGYPVGLYANGGIPGGGGILEIAPGSGTGQVTRILDALAAIQDVADGGPAELFLADRIPKLPWGATTVVIAGDLGDQLKPAVDLLKRSGHRIEVTTVGA